MNLQIELPDQLVRQVNDLAEKQHVSVNQIVAVALAAQVSAAAARPSIKERAQRVNWRRVDEILAKVPAKPPLPGDE
jgi:predicted transcriptional regulator